MSTHPNQSDMFDNKNESIADTIADEGDEDTNAEILDLLSDDLK